MRYVIIGDGPAGNAAAEAIRRRDPAGEIIVLSDEATPPYYRPLLPLLIENKLTQDALLRDDLHTAPRVTRFLDRPVTSIDSSKQRVTLSDGEGLEYDRMLLATGATPTLPPIAELQGEGMFVLRKLTDAQGIRQAAHDSHRAVVVGGGRIGVKAALALRSLGLEVTVIEMLDRLIPLQLDPEAGETLRGVLSTQGISVMLGEGVKGLVREKGKVRGAVTSGGKQLEADMAVVGVGVRANVGLASAAGLTVGNGVKTDSQLQTSAPGVYAAGDMVETTDIASGQAMVSGTWTNAVNMGHTAGENMAGGQVDYAGALNVINAMEVAGMPVVSVGVVNPTEDYETYPHRSPGSYRKLVFRGERLVGLLMVGDLRGAGVYHALIREGKDISREKNRLIAGAYSYAQHLTPQVPVLDSYGVR
ncbi:MAG: FAD-dependent oxidoreductase [Dehalococcoidia bacterium]|nr:FAD-dependent oxidoreductase [Dehalococcoidia bacterium]